MLIRSEERRLLKELESLLEIDGAALVGTSARTQPLKCIFAAGRLEELNRLQRTTGSDNRYMFVTAAPGHDADDMNNTFMPSCANVPAITPAGTLKAYDYLLWWLQHGGFTGSVNPWIVDKVNINEGILALLDSGNSAIVDLSGRRVINIRIEREEYRLEYPPLSMVLNQLGGDAYWHASNSRRDAEVKRAISFLKLLDVPLLFAFKMPDSCYRRPDIKILVRKDGKPVFYEDVIGVHTMWSTGTPDSLVCIHGARSEDSDTIMYRMSSMCVNASEPFKGVLECLNN